MRRLVSSVPACRSFSHLSSHCTRLCTQRSEIIESVGNLQESIANFIFFPVFFSVLLFFFCASSGFSSTTCSQNGFHPKMVLRCTDTLSVCVRAFALVLFFSQCDRLWCFATRLCVRRVHTYVHKFDVAYMSAVWLWQRIAIDRKKDTRHLHIKCI